MIKITNLHKNFGDNLVLKGISEHIRQGEVVSVITQAAAARVPFCVVSIC